MTRKATLNVGRYDEGMSKLYTIKPLVWRGTDNAGVGIGAHLYAVYAKRVRSRGEQKKHFNTRPYEWAVGTNITPDTRMQLAESLEAAKLAAEAAYVQLLESALEEQPATSPPPQPRS